MAWLRRLFRRPAPWRQTFRRALAYHITATTDDGVGRWPRRSP